MISDEKIENPIESDHPWAQSPKTIGSIATMYVSTLLIPE